MKREEAISVINKAAEDSKAFLELLKKHVSSQYTLYQEAGCQLPLCLLSTEV